MLKFSSNLLKIKLFYFNISGKLKKNNFKINTSRANKNIDKVLMIFPIAEKDFNVAKYSFRSLLVNRSTQYYFLINNIFYSNFHFIGTTYGFNYLNKKNKIIINDNFINDNILKEEFDAVFDLNSKFYFDISMVVNHIQSNYKIGFKKEFSDWFYNVQIDSHTLEEGYKKINSMLT